MQKVGVKNNYIFISKNSNIKHHSRLSAAQFKTHECSSKILILLTENQEEF